ncbi:MAG: cobalt-precorrin 5A hydrolase [Lachnospiraceae bacterium]|jgi:cobalt-precorrin 5A hydrolase|nr:cobalt-precorrin 5A hydrolase [Lachnospiraceae bacterium]
MHLAVISFTERGGKLNRSLCEDFQRQGIPVDSFEKRKGTEVPSEAGGEVSPKLVTERLGEWTGRAFGAYDGLIFVGACGIAVRAIAPFLKDKFTDPAVVTVDEGAGFVVSLLSGHVGGANDLCRRVAEALGAVPVISTATDVNGRFAVDVFAKHNGLGILDRGLAKEVSAAVLSGKKIPFFSAQPLLGEPPEELIVFEKEDEFWRESGIKIAVSERRLLAGEGSAGVLYLVPKTVTAGMGCRRGTEQAKLRRALEQAFSEAGIFPEALKGIATIEKKKDEEGLTGLAAELEVPFSWYTKEELLALSGEFSYSDFVEKTVGVGCVCERAAVLGSGGGSLLFPKQATEGITLAAARGEKELRFGKEREKE